MLTKRISNVRKIMKLGFLLLLLPLLVQCTVGTQPPPDEAANRRAINTSIPSQITRVQSISETPQSPTEIATISSSVTPIPTPISSEATSTPLSIFETPTISNLNVEEMDTIEAPLVGALAHIDPDTYKFVDKYTLYLMGTDGNLVQSLTDSDTDHIHPSWSPDCRQLMLVGDSSHSDGEYQNHLFLMDIEENSMIELTLPLRAFRNPSWAFDGKSIVFEGIDNELTQVYVYNLVSQELVQLTTEGNNYEPNWSPDGMRIVFTSDRDDQGTSSIYIMNADGSEQMQLLPYFWGADPSSFENPGMYNPQTPVWSPNGEWIAFRITEDAADREADKIYIMTNEGQNAHPVAPGDRSNDDVESKEFYYVFEGNPVWSPDGMQILFLRSNGFTNETSLCVADAFGGEVTCNAVSRQILIESIDWCPLSKRE